MQARSASERNPRGIPLTATRIPLLALRAWMKAGFLAAPVPIFSHKTLTRIA